MSDLLKDICVDLFARRDWVERAIARAPYTYKSYIVRKNNGGLRELSQPARETKVLQYWVVGNILKNFPVHDAAMAYVEGRGIAENANRHAKNPYLYKFDIRNFFPSIDEDCLGRYLSDKLDITKSDLKAILRILLKKSATGQMMRLSIGAPSSPLISNLLMYDFDVQMQSICEESGIVYTRYADDMTFSSRDSISLAGIRARLKEVLGVYLEGRFKINDGKTVFVSKKHSRKVTGLVLTNQGEVSIGRDRKRLISSMVHYFSQGKLSGSEAKRLQGLIGFALGVESAFVHRLERKYGRVLIKDIMKYELG